MKPKPSWSGWFGYILSLDVSQSEKQDLMVGRKWTGYKGKISGYGKSKDFGLSELGQKTDGYRMSPYISLHIFILEQMRLLYKV